MQPFDLIIFCWIYVIKLLFYQSQSVYCNVETSSQTDTATGPMFKVGACLWDTSNGWNKNVSSYKALKNIYTTWYSQCWSLCFPKTLTVFMISTLWSNTGYKPYMFWCQWLFQRWTVHLHFSHSSVTLLLFFSFTRFPCFLPLFFFFLSPSFCILI